MYDLIYFMITLIFRQSLSPYYFLKFPLKILNTIPDQGPADETPPILARGTAANVPAFNPQRTAVIVAQPDGGQEFRRVTDKPGIGVSLLVPVLPAVATRTALARPVMTPYHSVTACAVSGRMTCS